MENEKDDSVKEWFTLKNGKIMINIKQRDGVDDDGW